MPKNIGIARRKFRSISYKFSNSTINQDFNLQGLEQLYSVIRNRELLRMRLFDYGEKETRSFIRQILEWSQKGFICGQY